MGRRGEHTKDELTTMALDAAVALLEEEGPERLTTRAVAGRIGYTVGSLYFVFQNREDLILQVNERTLDELREHISAALAEVSEPRASLLAMGRAYLAFASAHPTRWRLIFEHTRAAGSDLPEPLVRKIEAFFLQVAESIAALNPRASPAAVRRSAQSLWGGVHGITVLALTGKLAIGGDAPAEVLTTELIGRYLDGMVQGAANPVEADCFDRPG
ncbi:TetR/AcrR family transcriptional regulator [Thiocapsa roseopersicina]|uniref:Transcriptional regulator, TetR family n=1 Tax=Thiocapsa roseopersicina TaxID=1058 RepID=A0A1H2U0G8_THIRO|nr:TetR/AcrR family transcriptional regulator [Thiocapsa roseopersicina]SDW49049.1 transcriptional regulator, TetR family [Thiocapsa roseopersicina]